MISGESTLFAGISIAIILSSVNGQFRANYGTCTTPRQESGQCIELSRCSEIYTLYRKPNKQREEIQYLRSSQCGVSNRKILVCCRDDSQEPPKLPSPEKRECGRVFHERIIGGTTTKLDEFPWTALLEYRRGGYKCGGSLISKRYVLTAAHCAAGLKPYRVRLGEWDTSTEIDCVTDRRGRITCADPHIDVGVERIIVHPQFVQWSRNQHFDIALLRLERNVEFTYYIHPICMPPKTAVENDIIPGAVMDVAGWGRTENNTRNTQKLKLGISVVSNADCQRVYGWEYQFISSQLCAGGKKGKDSCTGDSGGPLMSVDMVDNKEYTYLAGVVSFGPSPCGLEGWPGVYTKVSEFIDWILNNMTA